VCIVMYSWFGFYICYTSYMNMWSTRRKIIYISGALAVVLVVATIPTLFFLYKAPNCFDGKRNGGETGIDCGGACQLLCSADTVEPTILWSRAFKVTDTVYSALAYIENPNINSEAQASYVFKLYDGNNALIGTRQNTTMIPKNKVLAIFEPNISTQGRTPVRVTFEFMDALVWTRNEAVSPSLSVVQKVLTGESDKPRIDAVIKNNSLASVGIIEVVAVVYDTNQNAIAASRTFVDRLEKDASANVTFTWPLPFINPSVIEIIPRVVSAVVR